MVVVLNQVGELRDKDPTIETTATTVAMIMTNDDGYGEVDATAEARKLVRQ